MRCQILCGYYLLGGTGGGASKLSLFYGPRTAHMHSHTTAVDLT